MCRHGNSPRVLALKRTHIQSSPGPNDCFDIMISRAVPGEIQVAVHHVMLQTDLFCTGWCYQENLIALSGTASSKILEQQPLSHRNPFKSVRCEACCALLTNSSRLFRLRTAHCIPALGVGAQREQNAISNCQEGAGVFAM